VVVTDLESLSIVTLPLAKIPPFVEIIRCDTEARSPLQEDCRDGYFMEATPAIDLMVCGSAFRFPGLRARIFYNKRTMDWRMEPF
jgi:hypothetical protein